MSNHSVTFRKPQLFPNSKSPHLTWEEAMQYLNLLADHPVLTIKAYWANDLENYKYLLDLEHLWDVKAVEGKAFDFLLTHLGLAEFFEIEH